MRLHDTAATAAALLLAALLACACAAARPLPPPPPASPPTAASVDAVFDLPPRVGVEVDEPLTRGQEIAASIQQFIVSC